MHGMKCSMLALLLVAAVASAQFNGPYSEAQLRDLPNRYGNSFFETINPVGTGVLLQNQRPDPGFDLVNQEEWLTIYDNPASTDPPQSCGNGIREGYEVCDVLANWIVNPTCIEQGFNPSPPPNAATNVACTNDCTWDHQGIQNWACGGSTTGFADGFCGDGQIQSFEQCDFLNNDPNQPITGSATCQSVGLGFDSGTLGCRSFLGSGGTVLSCAFDFSNCRRSTPGCGNSILEGVEQCDPPGSTIFCGDPSTANGGNPNLGLLGAVSGGKASCSPTCMWDVGFCEPYGDQTTSTFQANPAGPVAEVPLCGNSLIDDPEQCDGTNLQGQNCASLGFTGGVLACSGCRFDIRGCSKQGGLVTVAAVGPDVTSVAVGDVVALSPSASCIPFTLNSYIDGRNGYCLVEESSIAVTLQEGNLFFDKSDVTTQAGFRNGIPLSGDLGTRTNF